MNINIKTLNVQALILLSSHTLCLWSGLQKNRQLSAKHIQKIKPESNTLHIAQIPECSHDVHLWIHAPRADPPLCVQSCSTNTGQTLSHCSPALHSNSCMVPNTLENLIKSKSLSVGDSNSCNLLLHQSVVEEMHFGLGSSLLKFGMFLVDSAACLALIKQKTWKTGIRHSV